MPATYVMIWNRSADFYCEKDEKNGTISTVIKKKNGGLEKWKKEMEKHCFL